MGVPTYDKFIEPVLRVLAEHPDGIRAREAHEAAANRLGLSDDDRMLTVPTGQPLYNNRAGWAHDRLKRAGLSSSPKRGVWRLTDKGREFTAKHPSPLQDAEVQEIARGHLDVRLRAVDANSSPAEPVAGLEAAEVQSPDDRLKAALDEIRESVSSELLELLGQVSPKYFETVVLDVLHKLGCVFRSMPAADSGACRPGIPVHAGHPFRSTPAGVSEAG